MDRKPPKSAQKGNQKGRNEASTNTSWMSLSLIARHVGVRLRLGFLFILALFWASLVPLRVHWGDVIVLGERVR